MSGPAYVWEGLEVLRQDIEAAARKEISVLVSGETGTGKEVIARSVHELSPRTARRFIALNCAAISPTVIESELFGHVRGAFTGATTSKKGVFEEAHGGTLFLDEIGEFPLELQPKLLRALQEREVVPVGATKPIRCDFRLVSATNRDLQQSVQRGKFREDLFHRISAYPVLVPPLRERPLRARLKIIAAYSELYGVQLTEPAVSALLAYAFPGNVRELANLLERVAISAAGKPIGPDQLPTLGARRTAIAAAPAPSGAERAIDTIAAELPDFKSWSDAVRRAVLALAQVLVDRHAEACAAGMTPTEASRRLLSDVEVPELWHGFEVLVRATAVAILWDFSVNWPDREITATNLATLYGGAFTRGRRAQRPAFRERIRQLLERPRG